MTDPRRASTVLGLTIWPEVTCDECSDSHFAVERDPAADDRLIRVCWCGDRVNIPVDDPDAVAALRRARRKAVE